MIRALFTALVSIAFAAQPEIDPNPYSWPTHSTTSFQTVIDIASNSPDCSLLLAAFQRTDLIDILSGPGPFTVFAPTNDAILALTNLWGITTDDLFTIPSLKDILRYNILSGHLLTDYLSTRNSIQTLNGQTIAIDGDNLILTSQQGSSAHITVGDLQAMNGVVHVIDAVMIPMFDSIIQAAQSFDDYSTLVHLCTHAGLMDMWSSPGSYTLFAPNNKAFDTLMDQLQLGIEDLLHLPQLKDVLLYHVIENEWNSSDLIAHNGQNVKTLQGQTVNINAMEDVYLIDNQQHRSNVVISNIWTANGIVYLTDSVILPLFDSIIDFATGFDDYSTLVELAQHTGLGDVLQDTTKQCTMFAPSNDAFDILMTQLGIEDLLNLPNLRDVLLYHVGDHGLTSDAYDTLQGQSVMIHTGHYTNESSGFDEAGFYVMDNQNRRSDVIISNVKARNGVVHVVNRVLVLLFDSVYQIAASMNDYSIFVALINKAGLVDELQDPTATYTVFAPHNGAFRVLMDAWHVHISDLLNLPNLRDVLLYHVIHESLSTSDLSTHGLHTLQGQTLNVNTAHCHGEDGFDVDGIFLMDHQKSRSDVIITNLNAVNGVVHVVDKVLLLLFDSVYQIVTSIDEYSILVQLVEKAGLASTLQDHTATFTVFAPNNNAFRVLMSAWHIDITDLLNLPNLRDVLSYHIIGDHLLTSDLSSQSVTTLQGQSVDIDTEMIIASMESTNGIVHVVDRVLVLLFDSVYQIVASMNDYSILTQVLQYAGFADVLQYPGVRYTVFAPNNAAFEALMHELKISIDNLFTLPNLHDILSYHIIHGHSLLTSDLSTQSLTTLQGQSVDINAEGMYLTDNQNDRSNVIITNVEATNGVVHVVDRVLITLFDSVHQILTSMDHYSILVQFMDKAGLTETLQNTDETFTLFAPNNNAFYVLMDAWHIDISDLLNLPNLRDVLLYHIMDHYALTSDLSTERMITLQGQNLSVNTDNYNGNAGFNVDGIYVMDNQNHRSDVIITNVKARNGVVHVVNRVLVLWFESVYQILTSMDDYSILVQLVNKAGLADVLQDRTAMYTVFAPHNDAFHVLMDAWHIHISDLLNLPNLSDLLLYHMLAGSLLTSDLSTQSFTTLQGQSINGGFDEDGIYVVDSTKHRSDVVITNLEAANGVVHVVDQVLVLLFDSVYQIITSIDDYSILAQLVDKAGLAETLQRLTATFTVFAPNNNAFYVLMDAWHVDISDLLNLPNLRDVLLYHILTQTLLISDLSNERLSTLQGQSIHVHTDNGIYLTDRQKDRSNVIIANVEATNGVVHVVDRVLVLLFDSVYQITASMNDYSILTQLLEHTGLDEVLQDRDAAYTVFAPNNVAFGVLMSELRITMGDLPNLHDVLSYHILPDYVSTQSVTTLQGQSVAITMDNSTHTGMYLIDNQHHQSDVIRHVESENGVVHVVNRVLVPLFDSVYEIVTSMDEYSIFVQLAVRAGLVDTLRDSAETCTVFVANNDAFTLLMEELHLTMDALLNLPILHDIFLYHIIGSVLSASDLSSGDLQTLQGQTVSIHVDDDYYNTGFAVSGIVTTDQQQRDGSMFIADMEAVNGIAHVIDRVMMPLFSSVVAVAASLNDLSIFAQILNVTGLTDTLLTAETVTVFAPSNDAFSQFLVELGVTLDDVLARDDLTSIILYHAVDGYYLSTDLAGGSLATLQGEAILINKDDDGRDDGFAVTGMSIKDPNGRESNIIIGNMQTENGVVYVTDRVLIYHGESDENTDWFLRDTRTVTAQETSGAVLYPRILQSSILVCMTGLFVVCA
eukprot:122708_1